MFSGLENESRFHSGAIEHRKRDRRNRCAGRLQTQVLRREPRVVRTARHESQKPQDDDLKIGVASDGSVLTAWLAIDALTSALRPRASSTLSERRPAPLPVPEAGVYSTGVVRVSMRRARRVVDRWPAGVRCTGSRRRLVRRGLSTGARARGRGRSRGGGRRPGVARGLPSGRLRPLPPAGLALFPARRLRERRSPLPASQHPLGGRCRAGARARLGLSTHRSAQRSPRRLRPGPRNAAGGCLGPAGARPCCRGDPPAAVLRRRERHSTPLPGESLQGMGARTRPFARRTDRATNAGGRDVSIRGIRDKGHGGHASRGGSRRRISAADGAISIRSTRASAPPGPSSASWLTSRGPRTTSPSPA